MMLLAVLATLALQDPGAVPADLRRAIADFERTRWWHLPSARGAPTRRCDAQVGRWCYWYDSLAADVAAEAPEVLAAREALLVELGAGALRAPGDQWLLGQRVRYTLEAGRPEEAEALVRECADQRQWCAALQGLVRHRDGDIAGADSSFSQALALMSPAERCAWLDLRAILPAPEARRWRSLSCGQRIAAGERWLELGRPLLSQAGNATRTEFLSRQVMIRIAEGSTTPDGSRFGADHRELVARYGWPVGWSRVGTGRSREDPIVAHDPVPAWSVLPHRLDRPRWQLATPRPQARFPVPRVTGLTDLPDAQLARLPRPDGLLLVAGWRAGEGSPFNTADATGVLAVKRAGLPPEIVARVPEGRGGVVAVPVGDGLEAGGIELLAPDGGSWARHRAAWPDSLWKPWGALSDLVLIDPDPGAATSLEELLPLVLRSCGIHRGGRVGVYWEWAGLSAPPDTAQVRLAIRREGSADALLRWGWPMASPPASSGSGSLTLDLSRLGRGWYELELLMTTGTRVLRAVRTLQIL